MLHYIKGTVTMKFDGGVVVEAGGIGYELFVPDNSSLYLLSEREETLVYTAMIVREDDVSLYGFPERESLALFQKLRTVSGVGAKAALAVLSAMPLTELKKAILFEDAVALTRANGVGKKTAQRIVLELKDKLEGMTLPSSDGSGGAAGLPKATDPEGADRAEAIEALMGLGYSRSEAAQAVMSIEEERLSTELYLKRALKNLAAR